MAGLEGLKAKSASTVVIVNNDGMGAAEDALRHKLLRVYLTMLQENGLYPGAVCFYASGVKMVVEGSPVLDMLKALEAKGVRIILCSTCLQYFGLSDKVAVGIVGGMSDILLAQWTADKVITL
jgi:sulfur relay (sulfurtransferase) complex TusBCD TusD component (DsrE family)